MSDPQCAHCGAVQSQQVVVMAHSIPSAGFDTLCLLCGNLTPCATCYGERAQDYVTCWTCHRTPGTPGFEPLPTDDPAFAAAEQARIRQQFPRGDV